MNHNDWNHMLNLSHKKQQKQKKMEKRSTEQLMNNAVYGKTGKFKKKN